MVVIKTEVPLSPLGQATRAGWPSPHFPTGTVVNARLIGDETDQDPLLQIVSPDGMQRGLTHKSNTEPVDRPPSQ
jgi:hypothetical protein